jgi:Putative lumazine-binding
MIWRFQMKRCHWLSIALVISISSEWSLVGIEALDQSPAQLNTPAGTAKPKPESADADSAAIRQTALDYIEGYYEGDAERMEKAVHPELAKRIVRTDLKSGRSRLDQMGAMTLVQGTRAGYGKNIKKEMQQKDVSILDIYEQAASVKIVATDWIDYLHMAKFNGRWVIVNVLWELKPDKK